MMIRKSIMFTEGMIEKVNYLQKKHSLPSFSAALMLAVANAYDKANPAYMSLKANETPEERVARKKQEKEAKEDMFRQDQLAILKDLGGKLIEREGNEAASYYTYSGKSRYEQIVSLSMLSTDLVKTQYQPSREKVEQLQKEGKVNYKLD